jgi:hypothetical protein
MFYEIEVRPGQGMPHFNYYTEVVEAPTSQDAIARVQRKNPGCMISCCRSWSGSNSPKQGSSGFASGNNADLLYDSAINLAALAGKGLWRLGKLGVKKYQENKESQANQQQVFVEQDINDFFDSPRSHDVNWKFASTSESFVLDGAQTLAFLRTPIILSRYIDDALDEFDCAPEVVSEWKNLFRACERIERNLVDRFPGNLVVLKSAKSADLLCDALCLDDLYFTNLLLVRLLQRDAESLGADAVKLQKRLSNSLKTLEKICSDSTWGSIELPTTRLTREHLDEPARGQIDNRNSSFSRGEANVENVSSSVYDREILDNGEPDVGNIDCLASFHAESDSIASEISTYGCIWYEREGFSLTPNPEGTLVISEKHILFVEADMDVFSVLSIVNNKVAEDGTARWIVSPAAVTNVERTKVSFRSAYIIYTDSGSSYKLVFMPGKGGAAMAKLRQLGIKMSF